MVTIQIKKVSDFDSRPELDEPRQVFNSLENLIANHHDTAYTGTSQAGSYLIANTSLLKRGNLSAQKFEECQNADEGNGILETKVSFNPGVLIMYINLREIGITEGRGSYELAPTESGVLLKAQELDCYKNSGSEEAHAVKRNIVRNYTVNGNYDWKNLMSSLMPDGILYITIKTNCHPGHQFLSFPTVGQLSTYSSLSSKQMDFPKSVPTQTFQAFGTFPGPMSNRCCACGGRKSVAAQTSTLCLPIRNDRCNASVETQTFSGTKSFGCQTFPSSNQLTRAASNYWCSCPSSMSID